MSKTNTKFRAWLIQSKRFADWKEIKRSGQYMANYFLGGSMGEENQVPDDTILQKFIGLKDKNDLEIYEGDIVHLWGRDQDETSYNKIGPVEWNAETLGYCLRHESGSADIHASGYTYYILGHIFENPELLEK